ncbi:MAG: hypothetical protein A2161_21465 [Candidatus Schekmanbacteria bacterium RBG_13_48_7]|uniref:carbonic anhydrase n=1 Tax=Candidatus Schekmanbacteria bacterium RBG_13_48_7 TaxID=1817878 RepID=A0A1F7RQZ6_9BACT|nr:MAG: hypothetical protein A2161_21465 [Candidatus Schekmanbacteria bacterium RBG_13_48_7]
MKTRKFIEDNIHPEELMKQMIAGNKEYMEENKQYYSHLQIGQNPDITLVTCCDSRVTHDIFGVDTLNEVFTIRNIGNQYKNSEGSIKFSLFHLKTSLLIIMGHTGCSAINAALDDYREEDESIQREIIGLTHTLRLGKQQKINEIAGTNAILKNSMYAEANVNSQILNILADPSIRSLIDSGTCTAIGMMFDIHHVYGVSPAHIHVVNVNGETDPEKIKKHKLFSKVHLQDIDLIVRNLQKS